MAKRERADLQRFALAGAEKRLEELNAETEQIFRMFPQLRARGRRAAATTAAPARSSRTAGRRRISAEGRKRISDAQKARWARQRGEAASPATNGKKRRRSRNRN